MNKTNHSPRLFFWSRVVSISAIAVVILFAAYGMYLAQKVQNMQQQWVTYNQNFTKISNHLQELHSKLGYGGLIHDFKNYVLRFNVKYDQRTEIAFQKTWQAIENLKSSLKDPSAIADTEEINQTIRKYYDNYRHIRKFSGEDIDIAALDKLVKVDDEPAFAALARLRLFVIEQSEQQQSSTDKAVDSVLELFYRGAWFAPMLLLAVLMMNLLMSRLRNAYHEVESNREFINNLISNSPDALIVLNPQGEVIRTNAKASELFGYNEREFKNLNIKQLLPALYRDEKVNLQDGLDNEGRYIGNISHPIPILCKMDKTPICEVALSTSGSGKKRVITASVRDITEREKTRLELKEAKFKAEVNLKRLQEAQESLVRSEKLASLGGLVAGIAHEINTPVGTTVTASSHLEEETRNIQGLYEQDNLSAEELEDYFTICNEATRLISLNCNRAATLIQSFKQVSVDQTSEERRDFELKSYINEIILSLRPKLKKLPHHIELDCPDNMVLNSYPGMFSQLFSNLIINSINHAWDEGEVGNIQIIVSEEAEDSVKIIYHDDGKGIPQQNQDKIFDPFFTTKRGSGGSGLGLHILHNLVYQRLGGEVRLVSKENFGTTFTLLLPKHI